MGIEGAGMGFQNLDIKDEYRSKNDDVTKSFYYPVLQNAIRYDRAVGFFSSSILINIAKGLIPFINNGGVIRLIASPKLSEEDVAAIKRGYRDRKQVFLSAAIRELYSPQNFEEHNRLALLSKLIEDGKMDIKLAVVENYGLYHEKIGIFCDGDGNEIAFTGSMNETYTALELNYESIDVYCSWKGASEQRRVNNKIMDFEKLWDNLDDTVEVLNFTELKAEIIQKYREKDFTYEKYEEFEKKNENKYVKIVPSIPETVNLYDYQWDAINNWKEQGYRGIFDMATGTGKTFTGIGALCTLFNEKKRLLAIIVCPQTHLVEQWVDDLRIFNITPIIAYGIPKYKDYPKKIRRAIFDYSLETKDFVCVICTKDTFVDVKLQSQISKFPDDIFLLVDEVHNMGARSYLEKLTERYTYRLGLSATFDRHHDEEGTKKLYNYFGNKCITYTLEQAIDEGKLTPYEYYPIIVSLLPDELERYNEKSAEIVRNMMVDKKGKVSLNQKAKRLAIERARIIAGAEMKLEKLKEIIVPYSKDNHILVYCGATSTMDADAEEETRQIDKITRVLGKELGMKVAQFTSRENSEKRRLLKNEFEEGNTLQALVAIKCLDEGVNIPAIKTAFILASTTNPKEYIQRRGRVLRLAKGKKKAVIFDFVTMPHDIDVVPSLSGEEIKYDLSLVKSELRRMTEFQRIADNAYASNETIRRIKEVYQLYDEEVEKDGFEETFG